MLVATVGKRPSALATMSNIDSSQANFAYHVGRTVGKYTLESLIGRGGMAEVYKSTHPELGRPLAIKILHPFHMDTAGFVDRFRQEAKAIATLRHPHIVQVYDFAVTEDGLYYMVMEYIDGVSLDVYLQRHPGPLPLSQAYTLFRQVAEALHAAHEKGIIHRDVKPANILIDRQGTAFLTDFGIAQILGAQRLTMSYMSPGTPSFMAPEQGTGQPITRAADIYALGGLLYQLLAGRLPYEDENPISLIMRKSAQTPVPPSFFNTSLPPAVDDVVLRAMALNPLERFSDALAMLQALDQARRVEIETDKRPKQPAGRTAVDETAALPSWTLQMPELLHHQIKSLISESQHTQRFLAFSNTLEQLCFLDVLRTTAQQTPDLAAQFRQHWQGLAQISHPHLAAVTTIDLSLDHRPFVAFEYVDGPSLAEKLAQGQPLATQAALQLVRPIAQALAATQEVGLVHQDLRPEYIVLRGEADPVLVGLGGPMAAAGSSSPSSGYIAPEQRQGQPVSVRSNIYSLAVILWELLSGQQAAAQDTLLHQLPAGLPAGTAALLRRCLQPNPENRPASWMDFISLLDFDPEVVQEEAGQAEKRPSVKRPFWQPMAAALAVVALLVGSLWTWRTNQAARSPETPQTDAATMAQTESSLPESAAPVMEPVEVGESPPVAESPPVEMGILTITGPIPGSAFTLAEPITFTWNWSGELAEGQQFVVYLAGRYGRFPLGSVTTGSAAGQYELTVTAGELAGEAGEYQWQVALETAVSGTMVTATTITASDPIPLSLTEVVSQETPGPPADISGVRISQITYNPPGDDSVGEFVLITNNGLTAVDMSGWTLQDDARTPHVYTFPSFTLAPGAAVQVWTGPGQDDGANLYWAFGFAIWNNDGDMATLFTNTGEMVSQCAYTGGAVFYDCP